MKNKIVKKIFISSNVTELKDERKYLKKYIPTIENEYVTFEPCMCEYIETFNLTQHNVTNSDSIDICLNKVEECDYYVLIIKEDYRNNDSLGCSVTEAEYERAKELKKTDYCIYI